MAAARCPCREVPGPATLTRSGSSSGVEDGRGWAIWEEGKAKGKDDQLTIYLEVPGYPQIWHPGYAEHYSAVAVRTEKEDTFSTQSYKLPTRMFHGFSRALAWHFQQPNKACLQQTCAVEILVPQTSNEEARTLNDTQPNHHKYPCDALG